MAKATIIPSKVIDPAEDAAGPVENTPPEKFVNTPAKRVSQVIRSPLTGGTDQLMVRKRAGYHQTWKREDEFDEAIELGYKQVRKPAKAADGSYKDEKPGYETGDPIKRSEGVDRWIVAMEIPESLYNEHVEAMSAQSQLRIHENKRVVEDYVEGANRKYDREALEVGFDDEEVEEEITVVKRRR